MLALPSLPAFAGFWTAEYAVDVQPYAPSANGIARWTSNTQVNARVSENIAVVFVWNHSAPGGMDKPPATVIALVNAKAQAGLTSGTGSMSVSNGFSDPITGSGSSISMQGLHLVQKKNTALSERVLIGVYSLSASSPQGVAYISLRVVPDDRLISLTRQGARGETVDPDGTIHGDTTRSYLWTHPIGNGMGNPVNYTDSIWNWQQFFADQFGGWHTKTIYSSGYPLQVLDVSFRWTPAYSGATLVWNQWSQLFGGQNLYNATWRGKSGAPVPETLTYTVTDNVDGAKAEANYILTRHDHIEETEHTFKNVDGNAIRCGNFIKENRSRASVTFTNPTYEESNSSYSVGLSFSPSIELGKTAAINFGLSLDYTIEMGVNHGDNLPPLTLQPETYTFPELVEVYQHHLGKANLWDEGGFVSNSPFDWKCPLGVRLQWHSPMPTQGVIVGH